MGRSSTIADSVAVADGNNTVTFDAPSWAEDGATYARFRLSTSGGLGIRGLADEGEVEDYQVTINPPTSSTGQFGVQRVVTAVSSPESVFAADVDGDGVMDVLSASQASIVWYGNDGSGNFTSHVVGLTDRVVVDVTAADVDGDGDIDVLAAANGEDADDTIAWYQNDGNQNFTENTITAAADGPTSVFAADVDADGDIDVLSASSDDNKIAWYENDGSQSFTTHVITTSANGVRSLFVADIDGDGHLDVVSASRAGVDNKVSWYENDGSQSFSTHTISTSFNGPQSLVAGDVDSDGDIDVVSASENDDTIAWHENDGSGNFTSRVISTGFGDGPHSVFAGDLDGDGDTDVLSASLFNDRIAMYENVNQVFTASTVSRLTDYATGVFAADVDGDGDLDVLSSSQFDGKIAWYENIGGNKSPTLDPLADRTLAEDAIAQTVNLGGISAGAGETQPLRVTAVSDTGLIPNPTVTYASPNTTGTLTFTPVADASGPATITVTVEDGGADGNFATTADNAKFNRAFNVTVNPVNDNPTLDALADLTIQQGAGAQTVNLTGIAAGGGETQPLKVTAASDSTGLIPNPTVNYASPQATGTLTFTPVATASGLATVTVTVEDGGLDNDLSTTADNAKLDRTFDVTVSPAATTVTGLVLNGGSANRSGLADLTFQFSEATTVSTAGSLILWNHTTGAAVDVSGATLVNNGTNGVTWNLTGFTLPEGNYTATLPQAAAALAATHSKSFRILPGDSDGDGAVGFGDFGELATNFNLSGPPYGPGDMDGDGAVGFGDFGILATNFNRSLEALTLDFGDAPESGTSFPTTLANDGARHVLGVGLLLGAAFDAEADGQPNANATGDGGDEDGVTFATLTAGSNSAITVAATVPGAAVLNAWIDFNADGDWDDAGEKIFSDEAVINGTNNLTAAIPAGAAAGQTFARFRITTDAGHTYSGLARDGEVEDYQVTLVAAKGSARRLAPAATFNLWAGAFTDEPTVRQRPSSDLERHFEESDRSQVEPAVSGIFEIAIVPLKLRPHEDADGPRSPDETLIDQVFEDDIASLLHDDSLSAVI